MKRSRTSREEYPAGARILHRLYTRLGFLGRPPRFHVEFFPYASLTHTIRRMEDTIHVRLSDVFRKAPLVVLEATAGILLCRLHRKKVPLEMLALYRRYSIAHPTRLRVRTVRRTRGQKSKSGPRGSVHDLQPYFDRLNQCYFSGGLSQPRLGWSKRPWRSQLGCFDPALNQIVISSKLDCADVPRNVVEYVLFHEMLHVKHPIRRASCGLQAHSAAFRRQEKLFAEYEPARKFLKQFI